MEGGMTTGYSEVTDMVPGCQDIVNIRSQAKHTVGRPVMNQMFQHGARTYEVITLRKNNSPQCQAKGKVDMFVENVGGHQQFVRNVSHADDVNMQEEEDQCVDVKGRRNQKLKKVLPPEESPKAVHPPSDGVKIVEDGIKRVSLKRKSIDSVVNRDCLGATVPLKPGLVFKTRQTVEQICNKEKIAEPQSIIYDKVFSGSEWPWNNSGFQTNNNSGTFGEVSKPFTENRKEMVMKKIKDKVSINEIEIPLKFNSPYIERVLALGYDGRNGYLVMENAGNNLQKMCSNENKNLWGLLKQEQHMARLLMDLLEALRLLGRLQITHSDIKPENVCLKWSKELGRLVACLVDFGSCKTLQDPASFHGVTAEYLPPSFNAKYYKAWMDMKQNRRFPTERLTPKDDVWALGMVVVFILWGEHPMIKHFTGEGNYKRITQEVRFDVLRQIGEMKGCLPDKFLNFPECPKVQPVIAKMLELDHYNRPSADEALTMLEVSVNGNVNQPKQKFQKVEVAQSAFKFDVNVPQDLNFQGQRGPQQTLKPNMIYLKVPKTEGGTHIVMTDQPKMVPKVISPGQLHPTMTLALDTDQTSGYGDVDMTTKKIVYSPSSPNSTRPVFRVSRPSQGAAKLVRVDGSSWTNSPNADERDSNDMAAYFNTIHKGSHKVTQMQVQSRPNSVSQTPVVGAPHFVALDNKQGQKVFINTSCQPTQNSHQGRAIFSGQNHSQYLQGQGAPHQDIQQQVVMIKTRPGVNISQGPADLNIPNFSQLGITISSDDTISLPSSGTE